METNGKSSFNFILILLGSRNSQYLLVSSLNREEKMSAKIHKQEENRFALIRVKLRAVRFSPALARDLLSKSCKCRGANIEFFSRVSKSATECRIIM